jgi:spermidine synthase
MTSVGDEYVPRVHDAPGRARASSPKKALVLGGGDGGAARQLLKHACIERIVVAELDDEVVGMARRYLDDVHQGALDDPRVEVVIGDAAQFVASTVEHFDLVVFDLTPPDSPAAGLYTREFYARLRDPDAARRAVDASGSPLFHAARIAALLKIPRASLRSSTRCPRTCRCGSQWLMAIASDTLDAAALFTRRRRRLAARRVHGLRYYDARLHAALFALPRARARWAGAAELGATRRDAG